MAAQLVPLKEWAKSVFGEHMPHVNTLRRWVQNGKILPCPQLVGRGYFCTPDAAYFDDNTSTINRILNGRASTKR
ncbi:excisionase [Burkholderia pyrrocinia]|uniref:excisionase n=1 Tax=Burkholderia pyrrocinia TaxID=60550 RepID=UPI002AB2C48C|nr:excisionase [Burkholderia pyrrocinia]